MLYVSRKRSRSVELENYEQSRIRIRSIMQSMIIRNNSHGNSSWSSETKHSAFLIKDRSDGKRMKKRRLRDAYRKAGTHLSYARQDREIRVILRDTAVTRCQQDGHLIFSCRAYIFMWSTLRARDRATFVSSGREWKNDL